MARFPRRGLGRSVASILLALGFLAVLGGTFALGILAGRQWTRVPILGEWVAARGAREAERGGAAPRASAPPAARSPEPALTFYRELTAPLSPVPPPKPARPPKGERADATGVGPPGDRAERDPAGKSEPRAGRFTIQVGAFRLRTQAEALRGALAAAGHEAYLSETEAQGGARYRVRVGSFATRDAAVEAAARLGGDRPLATYVTTR
ncbi:MAG: SPOR domain-containing protein [Candidatus Rokubacteria bacterium]|nr:SPOR domain-containing protein [Candidatus Rokubacteria bacterium]